jgi:hypothetical protein
MLTIPEYFLFNKGIFHTGLITDIEGGKGLAGETGGKETTGET